MTAPAQQGELMNVREVARRTTLSTDQIYKLSASGAHNFPRAVRLSSQRLAWYEHEISAWLARRAAERVSA